MFVKVLSLIADNDIIYFGLKLKSTLISLFIPESQFVVYCIE